jgi:hypothetical protein
MACAFFKLLLAAGVDFMECAVISGINNEKRKLPIDNDLRILYPIFMTTLTLTMS